MLVRRLLSLPGTPQPRTTTPTAIHRARKRGERRKESKQALDRKKSKAVGDICETALLFYLLEGVAMITACILHGGLKGGGETEKSNNIKSTDTIPIIL